MGRQSRRRHAKEPIEYEHPYGRGGEREHHTTSPVLPAMPEAAARARRNAARHAVSLGSGHGDSISRPPSSFRAEVLGSKALRPAAERYLLSSLERYIQPHNILIDSQGNARLADFDLALDERHRITHTCDGLGSIDYAAPEALRNAAHADHRADLYGLGRTVLFVYFGKDLPGESIHEQKAFIKRLPVAAPIKAVLETATAWHPSERFQTVQEFCTALRAAAAYRPSPTDYGADPEQALPAESTGIATAPLPERRVAAESGPLGGPGMAAPVPKSYGELCGESRATALVSGLLRTHSKLLKQGALLLCCTIWLSGQPASRAIPSSASLLTPKHRPPPKGRPDPSMISVTGGTIEIGSRKDEVTRDNEQPASSVTVKPFFTDQTEVTVASYKACVDAKQCSAPGDFPGCNWGKEGMDNHPANCVDWHQADQFCAWLGRRLPTEQEWEYVAQGVAGRRPMGGERPPTRNLCWARSEGTCPVASNPGGTTLQDVDGILGNVKEYTADPYRRCYADDCPAEQNYHAVRGGSYDMGFIDHFYPARRYRRADDDPSATIGFRCAQ